MDFTKINMCLGNAPHNPHNVVITLNHDCAGVSECGNPERHPIGIGPARPITHTITKVVLSPCDGMPAKED